MSVWAELSLRNDVFAAACLFAGKKKSTGGNICQFDMLFVQFTLQRSGPNWPFFRGAMMEQSDWCMHNSVPDDTPPAPPASMPQPLWGSTYFLSTTRR